MPSTSFWCEMLVFTKVMAVGENLLEVMTADMQP